MEYVFCLLFILSQALWRRCFGNDGWHIPVLKERGVQHILNIGLLGCFLYFVKSVHHPLTLIYCVSVIQGLWYSTSFYAAMDMGRTAPDKHPSVSESTILKDYDNIYGKITDLFCFQKYDFGYDFLWMMFRYTLPLIFIIPFFNAIILFTGLLVALGYAFSWNRWGDTKQAEYIMGAVLGLMLCLS